MNQKLYKNKGFAFIKLLIVIGVIATIATIASVAIIIINPNGDNGDNVEWSCGQEYTDTRDGKVYSTVEIDSLCWFAENINVGNQEEGTKICYYNNESNCDVKGGLYTWSMAMDLSSNCDTELCSPSDPHQGICPTGWRVPTDDDWCELKNHLATATCNNVDGWRSDGWMCDPAGSRLAGSSLWTSGTLTDHDDFSESSYSGFMALPSGRRDADGVSFYFPTMYTYWWSSSESSSHTALMRRLKYTYSSVYRSAGNKLSGFPVRCVRDLQPL